jgi:hypothetical protein
LQILITQIPQHNKQHSILYDTASMVVVLSHGVVSYKISVCAI